MKNQKFKVAMHCASCASAIDSKMKKIGATSISNPALKITKVTYDESKVTEDDVLKVFEELKYKAEEV